MQLAGKKILLAVSGSIAAYKTAFFVRLLIKEGAEVKIIMTESAKHFITPLTLATLSKNPVLTSFYKNENGEWNNHVELGLWADLMIIAPLSANTLGKMANGLCDNLLLATYLSAKCPVLVAPAMDLDMYSHPTTVNNLQKIESYGNSVVHARDGELASGLYGPGRMVEPEELLREVLLHFSKKESLSKKKILISSGPTVEKIDAVRFISNYSSGKMGYHLANVLAEHGAEIEFISGPVSKYPEHKNIHITKINSADEMMEAADRLHPSCDVAIFAAAVSDFKPKTSHQHKRKKSEGDFSVELIENPDISERLGQKKKENQIHIGFALETDNEEQYANKKLKQKNFDFIVLNSMKDKGAGFGADTNKVTIFGKENKRYQFELKSKREVAQDIVDLLIQEYV